MGRATDLLTKLANEPAAAPELSVSTIKGVGPKRARLLEEIDIRTLTDALYLLPSRYQDWRLRADPHALNSGAAVVLEGTFEAVRARPMARRFGRRIVTARLRCDAQTHLDIVWFNFPAYLVASIPRSEPVVVRGQIVDGPAGLQLMHPEFRTVAEALRAPIRPVYSLPSAIGQTLFTSIARQALQQAAPHLESAIPEAMRSATELTTVTYALAQLHCPPADSHFDELQSGASAAHRTLAMEEMFAFQVALGLERQRAAERPGISIAGNASLSAQFVERLPFRLTGGQQRATAEVNADLKAPTQMNRLLLGDVGSGKTVIALWATLRAVESGYQAAVMAPTELLAEQHYQSFAKLCGGLGVKAALLTGSAAPTARSRVLQAVQRGTVQVVFGTHALIQRGVRMRRLGLGVIDEQHRFGVFERARLRELGVRPNLLLMSATPIPRSFALAMLANLDVSRLDEMPPGRTYPVTEIRTDEDMEQVEVLINDELAADRRVYCVAPLIEDDADSLADGGQEGAWPPSVAAMARRLNAAGLANARIGVVHGRMKPPEKERVMRKFRDGELNVLVATTVIEVGIDVPQATLMIVVGAEFYGLAELHQLRGRVGRGGEPARCVLVASRSADARARARLEELVRRRSGLEVARADLAMRGPGDIFGARQSGALPLRFAQFLKDYDMVEQARRMAKQWLDRDPQLAAVESRGCKAAIRAMLRHGFSLGDVG